MSQVLDDLRASRDLLVNVGWTQGVFAKSDPKTGKPFCYCAHGAVNKVTFGNPWGSVEVGESFNGKLDRRDPVTAALEKALPEKYKYHLAIYNDTQCKTVDDAVALFDKAIELQIQKETSA